MKLVLNFSNLKVEGRDGIKGLIGEFEAHTLTVNVDLRAPHIWPQIDDIMNRAFLACDKNFRSVDFLVLPEQAIVAVMLCDEFVRELGYCPDILRLNPLQIITLQFVEGGTDLREKNKRRTDGLR